MMSIINNLKNTGLRIFKPIWVGTLKHAHIILPDLTDLGDTAGHIVWKLLLLGTGLLIAAYGDSLQPKPVPVRVQTRTTRNTRRRRNGN